MTLLRMENLRIETAPQGSGAPRALLHDLSLTVAPGEFVALVGESGSGKTLAARSILDLLPPGVARTGGGIWLEQENLTTMTPGRLRAIRGLRIGMVFQEPMVSLNPAITIGRQLEEGLKLHRRYPAGEIRPRILRMLERVRIGEPEKKLSSYPHEFSGGMRQRIMLASVMLLKPRLLIADEPTTALDTLSQKDVMDVMVELARDDNVAVLFITHDLGLVAQYARRVVVLEKGHKVEEGETAQVLGTPSHPYTRKLIASLPRPAMDRPPPPSGRSVLLSVEKASVSYAGKAGWFFAGKDRPVVKEVSLSIQEGETLALVGASGSGKSTLGRAILGLKPLAGGVIRFEHEDIATMTRARRRLFRRSAQLVFQDPFSSLDPRMRVGDIVGAPIRHMGLARDERRRRIAQVLDEVGLAEFGARFAHEMSGGQRQRVAIARAIISRPRLVVADEPVSALDVTIQRQVLTLLKTLQQQHGFACLFITHDLGVVEEVADRVVVMSGGEIVETGTTQAIFAAPAHAYTRALLAATPSLAAVALSGA